MRVRILEDAEADLNNGAAWYQAEAQLGARFIDAFLTLVQTIGNEPRRFPLHHAYTGKLEIRRAHLPRFDYQIVYEISEPIIYVLAVAHNRRDPSFWLKRL